MLSGSHRGVCVPLGTVCVGMCWGHRSVLAELAAALGGWARGAVGQCAAAGGSEGLSARTPSSPSADRTPRRRRAPASEAVSAQRLRSPARSPGHPAPCRSLPAAPQGGSVPGGGALAGGSRRSEATRADVLLRGGNQDVRAGGLPCGGAETRRHLRARERGPGSPAPPTPALGRAAVSWGGKGRLRLAPWAVVPCHGGLGWQVILEQAQASRLLRRASRCAWSPSGSEA